MENKLNFSSNPINSFHLMKATTLEWEKISEKAKDIEARGKKCRVSP